MDEFPEDNLNFITCAVWVPHGIAKAHPDKVSCPNSFYYTMFQEYEEPVYSYSTYPGRR